jgi:hypothetical protein
MGAAGVAEAEPKPDIREWSRGDPSKKHKEPITESTEPNRRSGSEAAWLLVKIGGVEAGVCAGEEKALKLGSKGK